MALKGPGGGLGLFTTAAKRLYPRTRDLRFKISSARNVLNAGHHRWPVGRATPGEIKGFMRRRIANLKAKQAEKGKR